MWDNNFANTRFLSHNLTAHPNHNQTEYSYLIDKCNTQS